MSYANEVSGPGVIVQDIFSEAGDTRSAESVHRAYHVQAYSVKDVLTEIGHAARRRPAAAIGIAVLGGFLLGVAIRSR
jgi:hypothetical protein